MTFFFQEFGADSYFILAVISTSISWIHNDSMYVRFGGIRNTKTWSKSRFHCNENILGLIVLQH